MASIRCAGSGMSKCFPCNCEMVRSASSCIQARKFSRPSMRRAGSSSRIATASARVAPGRIRLLTCACPARSRAISSQLQA